MSGPPPSGESRKLLRPSSSSRSRGHHHPRHTHHHRSQPTQSSDHAETLPVKTPEPVVALEAPTPAMEAQDSGSRGSGSRAPTRSVVGKKVHRHAQPPPSSSSLGETASEMTDDSVVSAVMAAPTRSTRQTIGLGMDEKKMPVVVSNKTAASFVGGTLVGSFSKPVGVPADHATVPAAHVPSPLVTTSKPASVGAVVTDGIELKVQWESNSFHSMPAHHMQPNGPRVYPPLRGILSMRVHDSKSAVPSAPSAKDGGSVLNPLTMGTIWVLDISGSMHGNGEPEDRSKLGIAKSALEYAVLQHTPGDHFAIVTFESKCEVLVSVTTQDEKRTQGTAAQSKIRTLSSRGGTDLCNGMLTALDQVRKWGPNVLPHLVLMTDGQPTEGVTGTEDIVNKLRVHPMWNRVAVSTIGFGGAGVAWDLLTKITEASGGGSIYGIEKATDIAEKMGSIFGLIDTTVAADVKLEFLSPLTVIQFAPTSTGGGRRLKKGETHEQLSWSQLSDDQERHIIFQLVPPQNIRAQEDLLFPLHLCLRYRDRRTGQTKQQLLNVLPNVKPLADGVPPRLSIHFASHLVRIEAAQLIAGSDAPKLAALLTNIERLDATVRATEVVQRAEIDIKARLAALQTNDADNNARASAYGRCLSVQAGTTASGRHYESAAQTSSSRSFVEGSTEIRNSRAPSSQPQSQSSHRPSSYHHHSGPVTPSPYGPFAAMVPVPSGSSGTYVAPSVTQRFRGVATAAAAAATPSSQYAGFLSMAAHPSTTTTTGNTGTAVSTTSSATTTTALAAPLGVIVEAAADDE